MLAKVWDLNAAVILLSIISEYFFFCYDTVIISILLFSATKIFVNGCWVGIHKDPEQLMNTLRKLRRQMDIIVSEVGTSIEHISFVTLNIRDGSDSPGNWALLLLVTVSGVDDQRHQRAGDQNLHRCRTNLSTAPHRRETEAAAQETTHRSAEGEGIQQLQVALQSDCVLLWKWANLCWRSDSCDE